MSGGGAAAGRRPERGLWIGLALGGPVVAYGVAGALHDARLTRPAELATWVVGAALVHDLVVAPVVLGASWLLGRAADFRPLPALRWALATSAVLVFLAWPLVRRYGRTPASRPSCPVTTVPGCWPTWPPCGPWPGRRPWPGGCAGATARRRSRPGRRPPGEPIARVSPGRSEALTRADGGGGETCPLAATLELPC